MLVRHYQKVDRGDGARILKSRYLIILVKDLCRGGALDDSAEDASHVKLNSLLRINHKKHEF
jgi:hypothetical protein